MLQEKGLFIGLGDKRLALPATPYSLNIWSPQFNLKYQQKMAADTGRVWAFFFLWRSAGKISPEPKRMSFYDSCCGNRQWQANGQEGWGLAKYIACVAMLLRLHSSGKNIIQPRIFTDHPVWNNAYFNFCTLRRSRKWAQDSPCLLFTLLLH